MVDFKVKTQQNVTKTETLQKTQQHFTKHNIAENTFHKTESLKNHIISENTLQKTQHFTKHANISDCRKGRENACFYLGRKVHPRILCNPLEQWWVHSHAL